jgi:hypothetical protein
MGGKFLLFFGHGPQPGAKVRLLTARNTGIRMRQGRVPVG